MLLLLLVLFVHVDDLQCLYIVHFANYNSIDFFGCHHSMADPYTNASSSYGYTGGPFASFGATQTTGGFGLTGIDSMESYRQNDFGGRGGSGTASTTGGFPHSMNVKPVPVISAHDRKLRVAPMNQAHIVNSDAQIDQMDAKKDTSTANR